MIKCQKDISLLPKVETRYRITATLLNSWQRIFDAKNDIFENENDEISYEDKLAQEQEKRKEEFIYLLERKPFVDNEFMKKGREYEDLVCTGGDRIFSPYVNRGAFQVTLTKDVDIDGIPITLYGVLDVLKRGRIMDIKRVVKYKYPKYKTSHQHPMYLFLAPDALDFTYLVADNNVESKDQEKFEKAHHLERYVRENCEDILQVCSRFLSWLKENNLFEIYTAKWQMK